MNIHSFSDVAQEKCMYARTSRVGASYASDQMCYLCKQPSKKNPVQATKLCNAR